MKSKVEFTEKGDISLVHYNGEMTFFFLEDTERYVRAQIAKKRFKFIIDMAQVTWIDSMGLGLMALMIKNALVQNTHLCIINPRDNVIDILRISSLLDLVKVFVNTRDAMEYLKH